MARLGVGRAPRAAVVFSALGPLVLIVGWVVAARLQPTGYDASERPVSALSAADAAHRWVFTAALLIAGAAHLLVALLLPRIPRLARAMMALGALATLAAGVVPLRSATGGSTVHIAIASVGLFALGIWPRFAAVPGGGWAQRPGTVRAVSMLLTALVLTLPVTFLLDRGFGVYERLTMVALGVWPFLTAIDVWWGCGHRIGSPSARLALVTGVVAVAGVAAGVFATVIAPATATTANYRARVWLDPDPRGASRLVADTVFGDIVIGFGGLAPGLRATPSVRAGISETLARPGLSLSTLQPSPAETESAVREAAVGLGQRVVAGSAGAALAAIGLQVIWRRRRPTLRVVAAATAGAALAASGTAYGIWRTYRLGAQTQVTTTGLLGEIQNNATALAEVEKRSNEVAPYLLNVIAVASALQQRYDPQQAQAPDAVRVLLISDVHASNHYPLIASIVADQDIDLVIDAGDLVNFGTVAEGEQLGVFSGIDTLPVPYLFVRGNHDATSAADEAVLRRLERIDNVILLQPNPREYIEVDAGGVRIAGFNDPRWFGDDGKRSALKQQPSREAFVAAFADRPPQDIVVSHEPWAVSGLPRAGVVLNGHMHSSFREGNRLQVGTVTGGGSFSHYIDGEGSEELAGQPSSFDILTIATTCRLSSAARYRFTDVIEGRPAYEEVTLLNGATVDRRPVDPLRTCTRHGPLVTTRVPAGTLSGGG
ncbi:MAG: DUF998 domain-containing protein [Tetrasphaera sp.]